jgi:anti-sigma B factor antagonist
MSFSIKTQIQENVAIIELQGEIDGDVSPVFSDELLLVCNMDIKEVVVDFSRVTFMDSSGIATLVQGLKWSREEKKSFVLKNASTNIINSLSLAKLETVFKIINEAHNSERFTNSDVLETNARINQDTPLSLA